MAKSVYLILLGKNPESKDLRDPRAYTELYRTENDPDISSFDRKYREFEAKGYTLKRIIVKVDEVLDLDETLEVRITKSGLKPSPKGTLGCDFDI